MDRWDDVFRALGVIWIVVFIGTATAYGIAKIVDIAQHPTYEAPKTQQSK